MRDSTVIHGWRCDDIVKEEGWGDSSVSKEKDLNSGLQNLHKTLGMAAHIYKPRTGRGCGRIREGPRSSLASSLVELVSSAFNESSCINKYNREIEENVPLASTGAHRCTYTHMCTPTCKTHIRRRDMDISGSCHCWLSSLPVIYLGSLWNQGWGLLFTH